MRLFRTSAYYLANTPGEIVEYLHFYGRNHKSCVYDSFNDNGGHPIPKSDEREKCLSVFPSLR